MSVTDNGNGMVMPVSPMGNMGYGGDAWGGGGFFWLLVIFVIAMMGGNGFGNGFFGGGSGEMQRGFDQQATIGGINGITASIASLAQGQCSGFADVVGAVNQGFSAAEIAANGRQMANMQQQFNTQTAIDNRLDSMAMAQQQCCCENRAAVADLKYTIANEAAATRQAILDKMCQQEIDALKTQNANLQNQLNMASFNASQLDQNNYLQNALTAQTQYFLSLYPPTAARNASATSSTT